MKKIVVNRCYGGFGLSPKAMSHYLKIKGKEAYFYIQTRYAYRDGVDEYSIVPEDRVTGGSIVYCLTKYLGETTAKIFTKDNNQYHVSDSGFERTDLDLIKVVEELGDEANGRFSKLEIAEIPDDVNYDIEEYDGMESIHEKHRSW